MTPRGAIKRGAERTLAPVARMLARAGIRPNHVSLAGATLAVLAMLPAATGHFTTAAILFLIGSSVDALDGVLARNHNGATRFGAVLDATLDRIGEGAIWTGLAYHFAANAQPLWAALCVAALLFSLLTSYLRAWGERFAAPMAEDWLTRPERVLTIGVLLALGKPEWAAFAVALVAGAGFAARLYRLARWL